MTFVDWRDMHRWKLINDALSLGMAEPVETYSTSEHLYTELDIPREATGTLPRAMRARAGLEAEAIEDIGETGKVRSPRRGPAGRGSAGRGSGRGDAARSGEGRSGEGRSGAGRSGEGRGGAGRGGSGQARKSTRGAGDGTAQPGGEATRTRRRRRTRAGRDLGAGQASARGENQPEETRRKAS